MVTLFLSIPSLHKIGDTITDMSPIWLIIAVILELVSCFGYVIAFLQVFTRAPIKFGTHVALTELAFGGAVSLGGAGSLAVGGWLMSERGAKPKHVAERSAVLFMLTSGINVITLILVSVGILTGILPGPKKLTYSLLPAAIGTAVLIFFLVLPRFANKITSENSSNKISRFIRYVSEAAISSSKLIFRPDWKIIGPILYAWADIGVIICCFIAIGGHIPPLGSIILAYQLGYLADIIPIPGNIGALDASIIGLMVIYGIKLTTATAATLVYHTIVLWIPASIGTISYIMLRKNKDQPLKPRSTMAN
jgi:uncharacterized membrane protein YbhN (UPF0104 family)